VSPLENGRHTASLAPILLAGRPTIRQDSHGDQANIKNISTSLWRLHPPDRRSVRISNHRLSVEILDIDNRTNSKSNDESRRK
jgi:hypothetical protein